MLAKNITIHETASVKDALKKLSKTGEKTLLVTDNRRRLLGTITDGDIRDYILGGKTLENNIREIYNKNPIYIKKEEFSTELAKKILTKNKIEVVPILDEEHCVIDFASWTQVFYKDKIEKFKTGKVNIPVVIMAGGKGLRLEPFTRILPKPLIPIGDKPLIEIIIDEFRKWGIDEYYLTLNHKGDMIEAYMNSIAKDYEIKYIKEDTFLGTVGGLKALKKSINDIFIVSNCDVIVKVNFEEVINFHKEQKALLTTLSSIQHYRIPYGVIKFKEKGEIIDIHEKPEYTFTINTGVYIFSRESLKFIPENSFFDMTDLIKELIKNNKKVVIYPIHEGDYIDIGQWEEYKKAIDRLKQFI